MIDLRGTKVLVTGGTRGIGRAVVLQLARAGADIVTCYRRDPGPAESLRAELRELSADNHVLQADVRSRSDVVRLISETGDRFGRLDAIVNNAGVISHVPFDQLPREEWQRLLDTNVTAAARVIRAGLPLLGRGTSIVNIGSRSAAAGIALRAHYTATKSALIGLTSTLAREYGPRGIRANVLALGVIETEALDALPPDRRSQIRETYSEKTSLGRLGTAVEVAEVVIFLVSDMSSYITGTVINVDGGI